MMTRDAPYDLRNPQITQDPRLLQHLGNISRGDSLFFPAQNCGRTPRSGRRSEENETTKVVQTNDVILSSNS